MIGIVALGIKIEVSLVCHTDSPPVSPPLASIQH